MHQIKNTILRKTCLEALADDNIELCLKELSLEFVDDIELVNLRGRVSGIKRANKNGTVSQEDSRLEWNRIRVALNEMVQDNVLPNEEDAILEGIHNRILVIAPDIKVEKWELTFSGNKFSHTLVLPIGDKIPDEYLSADVVVFDDTGINIRSEMEGMAKELPHAHFLYFGEKNPFTESRKRNPDHAAIFERCANANSRFTVITHLLELLEYRKKFPEDIPGVQQ